MLSSDINCGFTMLVGAQCDTSHTELRPPSNHQPVTSDVTVGGGCPINCTQILTTNSRWRQRTYRRNTVRASRRTRAEALLSLAVLKMYGKWF